MTHIYIILSCNKRRAVNETRNTVAALMNSVETSSGSKEHSKGINIAEFI